MLSTTSVRLRLFLGVFVVTLVTWIVVAFSGYYDTKRELDELLDAHLAQSASMLMSQINPEDDGELEFENVEPTHRYQRRLAYQVWDNNHRLRIRSLMAPASPLSSITEGFSETESAGQQWRVFSASIPNHGGVIQVGERLSARWHVRNEIIEHLLLPLLAALPCLALFLTVAIHRALRPLDALASAVASREANSLEPLTLQPVPKEVLPLAIQLNALFQRIRASLDNERRFTGDASHELRTPVAAIRTHAQVAKQSQDDGERKLALNRVIAGCDRITHLIDQLLTLARLDANRTADKDTACDLVVTARSVLAEAASAAYEKGISLELLAAEAMPVVGNEALLRVLIRNLVDNAIRYSPNDSKVAVNVSRRSQSCELEVIDEGPGISNEERARVLERFYRVVGSGTSGSGLGLSIVARIVELHTGTLELAPPADRRGLNVRVSLPATIS